MPQAILGGIATAKGVFDVSARTSVLPLLEFQHTRLDGQPFGSRSTAGLQWMHTGAGHWSYQALARFSLNTYPDEQFAIRDGREAGLNLDVARHGGVHSPLAQWSPDLRARSVWAESEYLGFVDSGGAIGVQLRAGRRVNLDVGTGLFRRSYNATDPNVGVRREDNRWSSQILLTTRIVKHLLARLNGTFIDNRANVDRYTYRQLVWGGALLVVY